MASAMKMNNDVISFNKDLRPYKFCQYVTNLCLPYQNPDLDYLRRFHQLLSKITKVV